MVIIFRNKESLISLHTVCILPPVTVESSVVRSLHVLIFGRLLLNRKSQLIRFVICVLYHIASLCYQTLLIFEKCCVIFHSYFYQKTLPCFPPYIWKV